MPSIVLPPVPHTERVPTTKEICQFTRVYHILDLANAGTPEGRAELALQARDAMSTQGFFYVVNHGLSQGENDRMFDIANVIFEGVAEEEKNSLTGDFKTTGVYSGYKPRQKWHIAGGVRDQLEQYNINCDVMHDEHPNVMRPFLPELDTFSRFCYSQVMHQILRLLALGLELPEDTFVDIHHFGDNNGTALSLMKYHPRSEHEEMITRNVWHKGHTDIGSVTILWSQPISALQILSQDGKWRWVRHIDNALVINAGDVMEFLSGGFYKATIHRVVQPPVDQRGHPRIGVFYFGRADDDVKLVPLMESPVLQRHGVERLCDDEDAPTMKQWRMSRTSAYGVTQLQLKENGIEEEIIENVVVKHYN